MFTRNFSTEENIILVFLLMILIIITVVAINNANNIQKKQKQENFTSDKKNGKIVSYADRRDKILNKLNKENGYHGQFYIQGYGCGRNRLNYDQKYDKFQKNNLPHYDENLEKIGASLYPDCNCSYTTKCKPGIKDHERLSFYNDNYFDTDAIFCYNCLLDEDTKNILRNYRNFPYINGPPGTNSFTF